MPDRTTTPYKTARSHRTIASFILGLAVSANAIADAPKVATDIAPIHSLASQVMKGVGEVDLIIPPGASPHDYSLKPSQAKALADADIVFWIGEELTPWLDKAINNVADKAHKVALLDLENTTKHEFREGATFEQHAHHDEHGSHNDGHDDNHENHHDDHGSHDDHHDEHEHDHGPGLLDRFLYLFSSHDDHHEEHNGHHDEHEGHDDHHHDGIDPHAWLDPQNAKVWIKAIQEELTEHDAANADTYAQNAGAAIKKLDMLISETQAQISELGQPKFIVFHDAYQYFEKRFGISAAGSISLADAQDPSPARIANIRETVQRLGVNCAFAEPQYDAGLVKNVFDGSSVTTIGVMDPLGTELEAGDDHYLQLIKGMVDSVRSCQVNR